MKISKTMKKRGIPVNCFRRLALLLMILLAVSTVAFATMTTYILDATTGGYVAYDTVSVGLVCDDQPLETDMPAILLDDRTMVPVRVISEQLGCSVIWNQESLTVTIQDGDTSIDLTIGNPVAMVNMVETPLYDGVAPILVQIDGGGRTMVPLRFISEQLGADVDWNQDTQTAIISTNKDSQGAVALPVTVDGHVFLATTLIPTVFELAGRVVLDFPGGLLEGGTLGALTLEDHPAITSIRYNQYDNGYDGYDRVARVVLDMVEGCDLASLVITQDETGITIALAESVPEEVVPEEEIPEELPEEEEIPPEVEPEPLLHVMLDAGHGGTEVSATHFGVDEKTVTLPIALMTGELLEAAGIAVSYTRTEDVKVTLQERVDMANDSDVDIFVSIHANAFPANSDIVGAETYYLYQGEGAKVLAQAVQDGLIDATGANNRGIKEAGYYVITHTLMPSILTEVGFLTNEAECMKLASEDYQRQIAEGIAQGILHYFGIS
ncbi:MAG: N-acetylmuramoyl-L-alanine amidase [Eubacteriales bacterium]